MDDFFAEFDSRRDNRRIKLRCVNVDMKFWRIDWLQRCAWESYCSLSICLNLFLVYMSVEFTLQSQHETFSDLGIQPRSVFNDWENESRRRPWGLVSSIVDKCELEEHWGNQTFTAKWTFARKYKAGTKGRIRHSAQPEWISWTVYVWM